MLSPIYIAIVMSVGALALVVFYIALLSRHRKASSSELSLLNSTGSVTEPLQPEGAVLVRGELWRARSLTGEPIECGSLNVRVVGARGHLLEVEPLD